MTRSIQQLIKATAVTEGAGVTVHRTIGTPALKALDPFLMLDHFSSDDPDEYIAGFPEHPHRGFVTFTYIIDGHMLHKDSMGNTGDLRAGGAQWMKAASGVIHSEMPQQSNGLMRGFQLWINLPGAEKMTDPAYQDFSSEAIPEVQETHAKIRILAGDYAGRSGVVQDPNTDVLYLDVRLDPGAKFSVPLQRSHRAFIYLFEGSGQIGSTNLPLHSLGVLAEGDAVTLTSGPDGARFILVSGKPIGEPIVQYGPFVMNTREEIEQAFRDYQAGRLVQKKAAMSGA
ncbi:MAG: pirin family protein [Thiobacillaceae bacterium]